MKAYAMKAYMIAGLMLAGLSAPAFAAEEGASKNSYVVVDTVDICSVIDAEPSAGMTVIGKENGYTEADAAEKYLMNEAKGSEQCEDIIRPV